MTTIESLSLGPGLIGHPSSDSSSHRRCPSCGSGAGGRLLIDLRLRTPDGHPLGSGYPVLSCTRCGTGFADVEIPVAYYEHYYGSLAKYAGETAVYSDGSQMDSGIPPPVDAPWRAGKADESAARIDALVGSRRARILDIGCSTGAILAALGRLGYTHLIGVDPAPDSVALAGARPGVRAEVGTFSSLPSDLGTFDCVCVTGVLEHLWEVDAAVLAVRPLLRDGGIVYVEVPDAGRYLDPYLSPFEDFSTEHVNHFSMTGLRQLAGRLGFHTIEEFSYLGPIADGVATGSAAVAWRVGAASDKVVHDRALERTLVEFTDRSTTDFAEIESILEHELSGYGGFALWGIGEAAFKLLALEALTSRRALAYVDGNPSRRGFRFNGVPVVAPERLTDGDVPIIVGSLIRADSIVAAAGALGLSNPLIRLDRWQERTAPSR